MPEPSPYYYGSAENKINSKGQVVIPARFRSVHTEEDQGKSFVIVRGQSRCLYMYSYKQFGKIKDKARKIAEEKDNSAFYRQFMAEACAVDIDNQGRFVLPQNLMKMTGITGPTVLFVGIDDRIEIWEPSEFSKVQDDSAEYEVFRLAVSKDIFGI